MTSQHGDVSKAPLGRNNKTPEEDFYLIPDGDGSILFRPYGAYEEEGLSRQGSALPYDM